MLDKLRLPKHSFAYKRARYVPEYLSLNNQHFIKFYFYISPRV